MSDGIAKVVIVVLVGLPASGKTSFSDRLKDYLKEQQLGINLFHICFDKLIKIDQRVIDNGHFKTIRGRLLELVKVLVESIHSKDFTTMEKYLNEKHFKQIHQLSENFNLNRLISYIIIDDNNYYRSMRYSYYQLARETSSGFCQVFFEIDVTDAIQRDTNRSNKVGTEIIQKMSLRLEKPSKTSVWERNTYKTDLEEKDLSKLMTFLKEVEANPETPLIDNATKLVIPQSDLHKIDLALRNAIHTRVSLVESQLKASTANSLQEKRKSILQDIRYGIISVAEHKITDFENLLCNT